MPQLKTRPPWRTIVLMTLEGLTVIGLVIAVLVASAH